MPIPVTELLSILLPVLLLLSGIGVVVIVIWLIWAATRPRTDAPPDQPPEREAISGTEARDFLTIKHRSRGGWEIRVGGEPYPNLRAIPNAGKRTEVLAALKALATFAGYQPETTAGPTARPSTEPRRSSLRLEGHAGGTGAAEEQATRAAERDRLSSALSTAPQERRGASDMTMTSIDLAHEIGEIVDEMLLRRPALRGHAVTLQNRPGHGIAFVVDGTIYQELADIPNPEIQALIRDATREWERR